MTDGYIYCFSNPSMPGILKVGMTERTPEARLSEANASDTWRPPTPYKIEFAKKVSNPSQKEKTLHTLLEQYTDRIHPRREFFRVSQKEVLKFFDLMDGKMWAETCEDKVGEQCMELVYCDKVAHRCRKPVYAGTEFCPQHRFSIQTNNTKLLPSLRRIKLDDGSIIFYDRLTQDLYDNNYKRCGYKTEEGFVVVKLEET